VAAKRRSVNATSTVLLPILKSTVECELKILGRLEKGNRKYAHPAGGRKRISEREMLNRQKAKTTMAGFFPGLLVLTI